MITPKLYDVKKFSTIKEMLNANGFKSVEIIKDYENIERIVKAVL